MDKDHPISERPHDAEPEKADDRKNAPDATRLEADGSPARHRPFQLWLSVICGITILVGGTLLFLPSGDSSGNADATAAPRVVTVSMRNIQFDPANIEITRGEVVEWRNDDLVPHTATSPQFDSKTIDAGQSWRHTFRETGNFPYVCTFHPLMKGVVVVK